MAKKVNGNELVMVTRTKTINPLLPGYIGETWTIYTESMVRGWNMSKRKNSGVTLDDTSCSDRDTCLELIKERNLKLCYTMYDENGHWVGDAYDAEGMPMRKLMRRCKGFYGQVQYENSPEFIAANEERELTRRELNYEHRMEAEGRFDFVERSRAVRRKRHYSQKYSK